ncbi:sensor histidine kinase [Hydrogenimonas sp.]
MAKTAIQKLHDFIYERDHREIMLTGLFLVTALLFFLFALLALWMGHEDVFGLKMGLSGVMLLLFALYRRYGHTTFFALLFLLLVEFESVSAMFGGHFYDFVTVYPFFSVFGFFFFFSLRMALWLTLLHYIFWVGFAMVQYDIDAANPVFHLVPLLNMVSTTLVVVIIGVLYHISTEITYERLEQANRQKAVLIKEIHHRIKNNLNKIASLLGLQMLRLKRGTAESPEEILRRNKLRIETMAMVHEAIYKANDLENIEAESYLKNLVGLIAQSYGRSVPTEVHADVSLPIDKMLKIGMIVNELYTNSLKYAGMKRQETPFVYISLHRYQGRCVLRYSQSGFDPADEAKLKAEKGLGMTLVKLSAEELGGEPDISVQDNTLLLAITFAC